MTQNCARRHPARRLWTVASCLLLVACSNACDDDAGSAQTSGPVASADNARSSTPSADAGTASGTFYCGLFGAEAPPTLLAVDVSTGEPLWRVCPSTADADNVLGRADGSTLLLQQNGQAGDSIVAIDDDGRERWRHSVRASGIQALVAGPVVVTSSDDVEAVDASTGQIRWTHPIDDGTPVGATATTVVELTGPTSVRGIDASTGEPLWTHEVPLDADQRPSQISPTVGDGVVAAPLIDGGTRILDASTGAELRTEPGFVTAEGSMLVERDANTFAAIALVEPFAGVRAQAPAGTMVATISGTMRVASGPGLLVESDPPTGPVATLRMIDITSGQVRWEIPHMTVIGRSAAYVFVVDGPVLQVRDVDDAAIMAEYRAPSDLITFLDAVEGAGIVVVGSKWRGT